MFYVDSETQVITLVSLESGDVLLNFPQLARIPFYRSGRCFEVQTQPLDPHLEGVFRDPLVGPVFTVFRSLKSHQAPWIRRRPARRGEPQLAC